MHSFLRLTIFCILYLSANQSLQGGSQVSLRIFKALEEEETKILSDSIEVVVFLSETCPICGQSIKTLNKLAEKYTALGVAFTGVFPNTYISTADTRKDFAKKYKIVFPLVSDPGYKITDALQATITPEVFIRQITNGKVLYQGKIDNMFEEVGKRRQVVTKHYVEDALIQVLKGREPDVPYTDAIGCFITR